MPIWAQTNSIEPVQIFVLKASDGKPLTGAGDLFTRIRRSSDGRYYDWSDATFKSAGWTTLNKLLTESDGVNAGGIYDATGGFNLAGIINKLVSDSYTVIPSQTGATGVLPNPEEFREGQVLGTVGVGARQVTIHVEDTSAAPLQGVQIDVFDNAATPNFITRLFTDVFGDVTIGMDDGTYQLRLFKSLHTFTVPEFLVVTANQTSTFVGTPVPIPTPATPDHCAIFGRLQNAGGQDLVGVCVQAFAVVDPPQVVDGIQLGEPVAETTTNQDGNFVLQLLRNSVVRFVNEESNLNIIRTVPDLPNQDLTTWT